MAIFYYQANDGQFYYYPGPPAHYGRSRSRHLLQAAIDGRSLHFVGGQEWPGRPKRAKSGQGARSREPGPNSGPSTWPHGQTT